MRLDFLATIVGVLTALQSRVNGELSVRLDNALQAAIISFGSGLLIFLVIAPFHSGIKRGIRNLRRAIALKAFPKWQLLGGILGGALMAIQTKIVPVIGVAIYSVTMIAGSVIASLIVDKAGFAGGRKNAISARRVIAASLTFIAVLISVWDRIDARNLSLFAVFVGVLSGFFIGIQRALNAQVNRYTEQSFTTSFLNFINGSFILSLLLVLGLLFHKAHFTALPSTPIWIYFGGVTGLIYIAFTASIVQHIGVLSFTLFSVGGQLVGSLLIDIYSPTRGVHVGAFLIAGIVISYVGVMVNNETFIKKRPQGEFKVN